MSLLAAIRGKAIQDFRTVFAVFLLTSYIIGTSQLETLHQFLHSHDHLVSHTQAQEKDPCHREIYHHDNEKGCGHHSHIAVTNKCELCDLIFHTDLIFLARSESQSILFFPVDFVPVLPDVVSLSQSILSLRAPPAILNSY
jgi:hypothetical protein